MASTSSSPEISAGINPESKARFSYKDATHDEVLEDLTSRFILNLPDEELTSVERICFQVEQAHWFYEDFIREENPKFPSLPLRKFSAMLFNSCPVLHHWANDHEQAFNNFMHYKTLVPVCGAIMLNETWDKCVLVKGWKSSSGWGFPKGKINETEPPPTCAVREVLEETGYNLAGKINNDNVIETTINGQKVSLFIVPDVPEDFPFKTKTRKEISKIEWFRLTDLPSWKRSKQTPGKFYLITPFIGALKAFVNGNKPRKNSRKAAKPKVSPPSIINGTPQTVPQNPTDLDALQESSSQSSSLDNGDPQTPSPQYTESAPAFAPRIQDDQNSSLFSTESLDPHFARLLSGLTMSAVAAASVDKTNENWGGKESLVAIDDIKDEMRTVQLDTKPLPPTILQRPTPPTAIASIRPISVEPEHSTPASITTPTVLSDQPMPPLANSHSSLKPIHHILNLAANGTSHTCHRLSPSPSPSIATVSIASTLSPQVTPRRTSTADISPYLTRPAEIPVSAKRLQQLALLESVADESARMTPLLANRSPLTMSNLPTSSYVPMPQMSPHRYSNLNTTHPPSYLPVPPPQPHNLPSDSFHYNPNSMAMHYDPFLVRSRTSQAFHRPSLHSPPSSVSMNQNQLLALINGSRASPTLGPIPQHQPWYQQHFATPYPDMNPAFTPQTMSNPFTPQPGRYGPPISQHPSGPRRFSSTQVGLPPVSETSSKLQNSSANTLLSILNTSLPPPHSLPTTPGPQTAHT